MKKIKICAIVVFVYIIFILVRGIYWYYDMDGMNVPIAISTQYSEVPTNLEVFIDGKVVFKDDSLQTLYASKQVHLPCGIHQLKVIADGKEFIEHFWVFLVRWIYIEIQKYDGPNYKANDNWFSIDFTSTPTKLM